MDDMLRVALEAQLAEVRRQRDDLARELSESCRCTQVVERVRRANELSRLIAAQAGQRGEQTSLVKFEEL